MPTTTPDGRIRDQLWIHYLETPSPVEPSHEYYSTNLFQIGSPEHALQWFDKIGQRNVASLRSLRLWMGGNYLEESSLSPRMDVLCGTTIKESAAWRTVFYMVSKMTHLRTLNVSWDADTDSYINLCGGADVKLVRALGKMSFLESLTIGGYFAKEWPPYLRARVKELQIDNWAEEDNVNFQRMIRHLSP